MTPFGRADPQGCAFVVLHKLTEASLKGSHPRADVLFEMSGRPYRDRELYFVRVFGEPGSEAPWGWSFEGHHISLNYRYAERRIVHC